MYHLFCAWVDGGSLILISPSRVRQVKEQLRLKRQEMAKSYLRSKKQLEELLIKRLSSLETIQSVLIKMDTAAGDIEVG